MITITIGDTLNIATPKRKNHEVLWIGSTVYLLEHVKDKTDYTSVYRVVGKTEDREEAQRWLKSG